MKRVGNLVCAQVIGVSEDWLPRPYFIDEAHCVAFDERNSTLHLLWET